MAHWDQETGGLCLHVVYDGPPRSGKTTTVHMLARRYSLPVETPEERNGRTLYFDWMDFRGGQVRGEPIQCRVIAVPGQDALAARRASILEAADVVVFVADTSRGGVEHSQAHFDELLTLLQARTRPIPILVQFNKRDAEDAVELDELKQRFGDRPAYFFESVATDGDGVQETFALAIGEGVRALFPKDSSPSTGRPWIDNNELDLGDARALFERLLVNGGSLLGSGDTL